MHRTIRLVTLFLCAACDSVPALGSADDAVTLADPDAGDHAVVQLTIAGRPHCSATLIDVDTVLSAAHCLTDSTSSELAIIEGDVIRPIVETRVDPNFDPRRSDCDVGLARLGPSPTAVATATLPLGTNRVSVGDLVRLVGFGAPTAGGVPGIRRAGWSRVVSVQDRTFTTEPAPSQACQGDSGGPALISQSGVERIAGVISAGNPDCEGAAILVRIDTLENDFAAPFPRQAQGCAMTKSSGSARGEIGLAMAVLVVTLCRHRRSRFR
jgi:hypothetical protein